MEPLHVGGNPLPRRRLCPVSYFSFVNKVVKLVIMPVLHHTVTVHKTPAHRTQTIHTEDEEGGRGGRDLVHPDLLIGHAVDDAVVARVHVPQVVSDGDDGKGESDHQPQHDVEDHSVLKVVLVGQVVRASGITLQTTIRGAVVTKWNLIRTVLVLFWVKLTICLDSRMERDFLVRGASNVLTVTTSTTALLPYRPYTSSPNCEGQTALNAEDESKTGGGVDNPIRISFLLSGGQWQEWLWHRGTGASPVRKAC